MSSQFFGRTSDGNDIRAIDIAGGRLRARVIEWGAAIQDLTFQMPDGPRRIVLGLNSLEDYVLHSPHMGAIAGRYAMRIRDGRFRLDDVEYQLTPNGGKHHVHGGKAGFGKRPWKAIAHDENSVQLELTSPDGDEGYPGALSVRCLYTLYSDDRFGVELTAETTKPTVVNLVHHSYFDLGGEEDSSRSSVEIAADTRVETDAEGLPTGRLVPVAGTHFDFRKLTRLPAEPVDATYAVAAAPRMAPEFAAALVSPAGDLRMDVLTTEPGLHLYDGGKLAVPVPGLGGRRYAPRAGVCLEPHRFADAPNHAGFPVTVLRPGEVYRQRTVFAFTTPEAGQ